MPAHKRGPWSQAEDSFLLSLVHSQGAHNWVRISTMIQTRSPKQCRERYHQNLKPNLNHDPITPEEGARIEQMVAEMGKRWAEIARRLRGRSDNAVKNWWNGGQNRRRRNQQRRAEMQVRDNVPHMGGGNSQMMQQSHGIPDQSMYYTNSGMQRAQTYYEQSLPAIYQQQAHIPPNLVVPQYAAPMRQRSFDTPLPSPSTYSQLSAEGAPSLVSDSSTNSARSPYPTNSPLDLPPLGMQQDFRRSQSNGVPQQSQQQRLGVPGYQPSEEDFQPPTQMHMTIPGSRAEEMKRQGAPMMQDFSNYPTMQGYRTSSDFATPQMTYGTQSPLPHIYAQMDQNQSMQQQQQHHHQHHQQQMHGQQMQHNGMAFPTMTGQLQLPSFANRNPVAGIDPSLEKTAPGRDQSESPKERMRLSSMINS